MYVESTDLVQRSDRIGFRSLFPLILRQLIRNTSTGMKSIDLPVLDASEQRGYDGIVEVGGGNEYVPNGKSVWEISTQDGPKGKANSDYKKRTESPGIIVPKETTFVFVTSRRWHDKNEWIEEKKKDSPWKDVKVIDANNIEDWLYTSNSHIFGHQLLWGSILKMLSIWVTIG